jgi:hypothetical protein
MRKLLAIVALLTVPALAAAGCGNNDEAASGASELVPAGALVYAEADLAPDGDQKQAVDSILAKFPGGGRAGDKLKELVDKGLRKSDPSVSYEKDIEPWLGDEAAFFASSFGASGGHGALGLLVATDDEDAALDTLKKTATGKVTEKSYRDVDYLMDESPDLNAAAAFDGFLVIGTESGVKAAIDTSKDGSTLSDDDRYKDALDKAADDRLGLFYLNLPELKKQAEQAGTGALPQSFNRFFNEPAVATARADDDGVLVQWTASAGLARSFGLPGGASELISELPADAWAAFAQGDFGKVLDNFADSFGAQVGGRDAIEQQLKAATGLDLQRDVLDWMGDFAVFVRGRTVSQLDGALVIQTKDEAASGRFIDALERLARNQAAGPGDRVAPLQAPGGGKGFTLSSNDVPKPIHVLQRNGRVVFAYGDAAARDGAEAGDKLGDSPDFSATRDSLGGDYTVSFYVLTQPIWDLVESTDSANDPDWQKAKPYLEPLKALVGGTSGEGDDVTQAVKLIIK